MKESRNNVLKEWKEVKLGEVLELKNGERPKINDYGIIPVYGANGIMGKTNDFLVDNDFTIIVGRVGASGEIHLAKGKVWISDNAIYSQSYKSKKIHLPFLFYLLTFKNLKQFATKTTHPIITQSFLKNLPIPLPPLPEQQKIAEILSTVDSAIEKVNQAIEKTQRLKKGLMQELLTKGIGYNEFKDTEIGRIPKEWEVVRLKESEEIKLIMGQSPPGKSYNKEGKGLPFIQGKAEFGNMYPSAILWTTQPTKIAEEGDVLISVRAPVGDVNICPYRLCIGRGLAAVRIKKGSNIFYFYWFQKEKQHIENIGKGSTFKAVTKDELSNLFIPFPPLPEQQKIAEILSTVDKRLELLKKKKEKLERIKKGLMNDLLTGKRRVKV
ncbi:MAG: restriction endonuclease subunit S [Candidatus Desulfofervidus auxilii]|nr:restriction endonuclease subunit S [Candidatus Desulfofervidus auxilii]